MVVVLLALLPILAPEKDIGGSLKEKIYTPGPEKGLVLTPFNPKLWNIFKHGSGDEGAIASEIEGNICFLEIPKDKKLGLLK